MNCAAFGATKATPVASTNTNTGNSAVTIELRIVAAAQRENPQQRIHDGDHRQVEAVDHGDHAIEPIAAVEAVGHRQDDDR